MCSSVIIMKVRIIKAKLGLDNSQCEYYAESIKHTCTPACLHRREQTQELITAQHVNLLTCTCRTGMMLLLHIQVDIT